MRLDFKLALHYLSGRKLRTTLTTLAIVFGVMVIFSLNSLIPTFMNSFKNTMLMSADQVDMTLTSKTKGAFEEALIDTVAENPAVSVVTGIFEKPVVMPASSHLVTSTGKSLNTVNVIGIQVGTYEQIRKMTFVFGDIQILNKKHHVIISENLSTEYNLPMGATFEMPSAKGAVDLTVGGIIKDKPGETTPKVLLNLDEAQDLFNAKGLINTVDVMFTSGSDVEAVQNEVMDRVGYGYKLGGTEVGGELVAALKMGEIMFNGFGGLSLLVGAFIIFITFRTIVVERRHDIGLLRAIGASRRKIISLILSEGLMQGAIGTLVGLAAGYLAAVGMVAFTAQIWKDMVRTDLGGPVFSVTAIAMAIGLGVGVTLIAGLLPAVAAGKLSPLEALSRSKSAEQTGSSPVRKGIGLGLAAIALVGLLSGQLAFQSLGLLLFIVSLFVAGPLLVKPITQWTSKGLMVIFMKEGRIARGNLENNPKRAAMTASTVMIGLALLVAMAGMTTSLIGAMGGYLDKSVGSDFIFMPQSMVLSGGNLGAGPELMETLKQTEGIDRVTSLRIGFSQVKETAVQVIGIEPEGYDALGGLDFNKGDDTAFQALKTGRKAILNGVMASSMQVSIGDSLALATPEGEKTYEVVGIGNDFLNAKFATVFISQDNLKRDFHEENDILILVNQKPEAESKTVQAKLEELVKTYTMFSVLDTGTFKADLEKQYRAVMILMYFLVAGIAIPSFIALVNTLSISVLERTREIGVMKAVGATSKQVKRIIVAESLLLASLGTFLGLLVGLWMGYVLAGALNAYGYRMVYSFPWGGVVVTLVTGLLFGWLGAWLPAKHALKFKIIEALKYE